MPQLNPAPWFFILVFTWLIFLTIIPYKILNHTFTNDMNPISTESLKTDTWNWPWH
uniref:ATP synthase complex subunit 8 n=4 Tax=Callichthyidae TaxID=31012 RepID=Q85DH9_9TELE|nr:ATP synthase F0 subunit 8 [Corydoras rabauti]YP_009861046.1 ATP synthase F0 subunit 8 [Corydoras sterbai]YP_009868905.1 ATP synthase F0 subunit 8 [Corydoras trilineatus]YP_010705395.1 ATP synthase F0 subunit 8 [Corydoras cruziensis]YP_010833205.1 ATP synthase F0 subunit 8 [Corydoras julii]QGW14837.1 ATP synthase F0 subunit 8 [Brochis multiradiatus]QKI32074.1 ATP synthase F0 subunit 8 [Corydoras sterbai]QKJ80175.1 ATP synthase F0 subunit 8 [Corydoras trilineatus]WCQ82896.1 ATP synthase F0